MTVLNTLSPQHRDLIVKLPYRVGYWVSESDATGGDEASDKELQALHNILDGFSYQVFGSELLQHIMAATLAGKDDWEQWQGDIHAVPKECAEAMEILGSYVDDKDVKAYAVRLMEVGEAVALAFREYDHVDSPFKTMQTYIAYMCLMARTRLKSGALRSFDEFVQISPHERKALTDIAARLGTTYV